MPVLPPGHAETLSSPIVDVPSSPCCCHAVNVNSLFPLAFVCQALAKFRHQALITDSGAGGSWAHTSEEASSAGSSGATRESVREFLEIQVRSAISREQQCKASEDVSSFFSSGSELRSTFRKRNVSPLPPPSVTTPHPIYKYRHSRAHKCKPVEMHAVLALALFNAAAPVTVRIPLDLTCDKRQRPQPARKHVQL